MSNGLGYDNRNICWETSAIFGRETPSGDASPPSWEIDVTGKNGTPSGEEALYP